MNKENYLTAQQQEKLFQEFAKEGNLSPLQLKQFETYMQLLLAWNEKFNITAITSPLEIIKFHFQDSLMLGHFLDFDEIKSMADVGTGGGFPGIPLKIRYPHVAIKLIEVNQKKIQFLKTVIQELHLEHCEIIDLDWRTFLRKTHDNIDLFVSRASLSPDELIRIFKPDCPYRNARMVYWASQQWVSSLQVQTLIEKELSYKIDHKPRKLIFFKKNIV